ncbi:MAG: polymer-forming cytoskeletal protein [Desulfarculaceae bacterium]|jgi:cytoskeletal protein CcmA (bactofilin family)
MASKQSQAVEVFLGSRNRLQGTLHINGFARLDGSFEGQITGEGDLLVGANGSVKAEIRCKTILVQGEVTGDVWASHWLDVRSEGTLKGQVYAPQVTVAEGALVEGQLTMAENTPLRRPI